MTGHQTVLLQEAVDALHIDPNGFYVDGTFGRGGHSRLILQTLGASGRLLAFDRDPQAIQCAQALAAEEERFDVVGQDFASMRSVFTDRNELGECQGLLLDLGVSSPQLDEAGRGFSFMRDGPLDMRMDNRQGVTAADVVNYEKEAVLVKIFREYGEEKFSGRIASAICERRKEQPFTGTLELAKLIEASVPRKDPGKHPATRIFQGLRIYVNRELEQLELILADALDLLAVGGRLAVISFHSLEDRLVKRFIQKACMGDDLPRGLPVTADALNVRMKKVGKAVKASKAEVSGNPRSRSAVLRVAERIA